MSTDTVPFVNNVRIHLLTRNANTCDIHCAKCIAKSGCIHEPLLISNNWEAEIAASLSPPFLLTTLISSLVLSKHNQLLNCLSPS